MEEKEEWKTEPGNQLAPEQVKAELNDSATLSYPYPTIFQILDTIICDNRARKKRLQRQMREDLLTKRRVHMALTQVNNPAVTKEWRPFVL